MGVFHQMGPPMTPSPLTQLTHPVLTLGVSCCCGARLAIGTRQMLAVPKFVSPFWIARSEHRFSYPGLRHLLIRAWSATFSRHR